MTIQSGSRKGHPSDSAESRGPGLRFVLGGFLLLGLPIVSLVAVVAITKNSSTGPPERIVAESSSTVAEISLSEFAITGDLEVPAGSVSLAIQNDGAIEHNLAVRDLDVGTPNIAPGSDGELDLGSLSPGSYEFYCTIPGHLEAGMVSTFTVTNDGNDTIAVPDDGESAAESAGSTPGSDDSTGTAGPVVSTLDATVDGFDMEALAWQGYWFSRYNLGSVVMMSGLGVGFEPPMEAVMAMAAMVDQGAADGEHVVMPANASLLRAVYAGGSAEFANAFNGDPSDLANFRWDLDAADTRIIPAAQAQTIMKEVEWAKLFNNGGWAGAVDADFGAMDRFKGMAMFAGATNQARFALDNLRNDDGLFVAVSAFDDGTISVEDDSVNVADQYQMLQALSDLRLVLQRPEDFNGVYANPDYLAAFGPEVDEFFATVLGLEPVTVLDHDLAGQAMAWFAASTTDDSLRAQAITRLEIVGDKLTQLPRASVVERAQAIRGLLESGRITANQTHIGRAVADFEALRADYQPETGSFLGVDELSTWEVADILGALNSLRFNTAGTLPRADAEQVLVGFFEATVDRGGLMRAFIPKEMEASPFELERLTNDLYFAYPGMPSPDQAGGPFGSAAVETAAISYDVATGDWSVSDRSFTTQGSMHASNEMFWIWGFQNGFPEVPQDEG